MRWNYSCKRKNGNTKEPCIGGVLGCPYEFNCKTSTVVGKAIVIFFSYMALLMLTYGDRMEKTWEACRMVEQEGLSYREAEQIVESDLFLDEYPQWNIGSPHQLVILHKMFLHVASQGQKEAECMCCRGCQGPCKRDKF